jgi:flagellar biosynthetic protein FliP
VPIQTLLFFTALSFLPAVLLLMTGFTRIVIVLSLLRQALGTQAAPPNQVIVGLSLFLTFFVMGPTLDRVYEEAYAALLAATRSRSSEALSEARRGAAARVHAQADAPVGRALFAKMAKLPAEGEGRAGADARAGAGLRHQRAEERRSRSAS